MPRNIGSVSVSLLLHGAILFVLALLKFTLPANPEMVMLTSEVMEAEQETDLLEALVPQETINATLTLTSANLASPGGALAARMESAADQVKATEALRQTSDPAVNRPLHSGELRNFNLDSQIENGTGMQLGNNGGDGASVDHIALEIRRALEKGRVLVCWVLDSSYSMRKRREAVIGRFKKVYDELERFPEARERGLLTGVMAFGQKNQLLLKEPTADPKQIIDVVKAMKDDESGVENVYGAVREVCNAYRKYQRDQRRHLMLIVLTDEIGDDMVALDDAVTTCQRQKVPVYVLGPMAPFGRKQILGDWTDPQTKEVFQVPMERGPESLEPEHLALPYWGQGEQFTLFGSGFGPYGLTRLVRETGGLYFMDDSEIRGVRFDPELMREYKPDYTSINQYLKMKTQNPLRVAVLEAARSSATTNQEPPFLFPGENMGQRMTDAQRIVAKTERFVEDALRDLRAVEKLREKETSKRWQAHYDLMLGRLLANRVRCAEYNWALAQMKVNPKTPATKPNNAWRLAGDAQISFGKKEVADAKASETNVRKADPKATAKAKEDADAALKYLRGVSKDHPDTPWSRMADRELQTPLGFKWVEAYIPPPPKPGQPMTPAQQAQAERDKRRAEAMKRVPAKI